MSRKKKLAVVALDPSLTLADIEILVADLGQLIRDDEAAIATADAAKAEADRTLSAERARIGTSLAAKTAIVSAWADKHRATICAPGTKTAQLATGEISWRFTPKSVSLRGVEEILKTLKERGLQQFIRTKDEVDKEAVLKEPAAVAAVAGITVADGVEKLYIKPHSSAVELEALAKVAA